MSVPIGVIPSSDIRAAMSGVGNVAAAANLLTFTTTAIAPHLTTVRASNNLSGNNIVLAGVNLEVIRFNAGSGNTEAGLQLVSPLATQIAAIRIAQGGSGEAARLQMSQLAWLAIAQLGLNVQAQIRSYDNSTGGTVFYQGACWLVDMG